MKFQTGAFFSELEDASVKGFAIVAVASSGGPISDHSGAAYRIAEKWQRSEVDGGPVWHTYWMDEQQLLTRVNEGKCKKAKTLSDKQLSGVKNLAEA